MDIRLALITGVDIPIPECQLVIHQPTIKEISYIGESEFFVGVQTLCLHKEMFVVSEDKNVLDSISNFQIFMMIMTDKETKDKKKQVMEVLTVIFPNYKVFLSPNSLIFQPVEKDEESVIVDETNFDFLQNVMREVFCAKSGPMDQQAFNPANSKAKEIADKLMRGRQRVAAQKGTANLSIFSIYLSSLAVALHMPITYLAENYTMFMVYDQVERYSLYMNWDIDLRVRLAGGKPDSNPDNWMKNIH